MLLLYEIDPICRAVVVTLSGQLANEDFLAIYEALRNDRIVRPDFSVIVDLSQATGINLTDSAVYALAQFPLVLHRESRRALVLPNDLGLGMLRLYEFWRGEPRINLRVFRDLEEAKAWARSAEAEP